MCEGHGGTGGAGPRVRCCVPFCTRSRGDRKGDPIPRDRPGYEWICGPHWRLVPASVKARRRQLDRRRTRLREAWDRPRFQARVLSSGRHLKYLGVVQRAAEDSWRAWGRCKALAIETAMGVTA